MNRPKSAASRTHHRNGIRDRARAVLFVLALGAADAGAITFDAIIEAKGGGAIPGGSFRNGYRMAINEINAAGGILGEAIKLKEIEIDSKTDAAEAATKEALADAPFAILGPVFSGLTLASFEVDKNAGVPQFHGGEAASISRRFPLTLYRTSLSQRASLPRLASFVAYGLQVKKVMIVWVDNEFGRDGRDVIAQTMSRFGGKVGESIGVPGGTQDFAAVTETLLRSDAEALIIYMNESESAALLKQLHARGFSKPIVGDGPLVAQIVLAQAGPAAEGVYAHVAITAEAPSAPIRSFVERYQKRYGTRPDHNSIKGYFAVRVIKTVVEQIGRIDRAAFAEIMKTARIDATSSSMLLNSATYFNFGDINRESYVGQVRNGVFTVLGTIPMTEGAMVELPNGKFIHLNSREGRIAVLGDTTMTAARRAR